jgi:hypothetical protein
MENRPLIVDARKIMAAVGVGIIMLWILSPWLWVAGAVWRWFTG